jgi:ubiquinone/menaquinone biosynthesis C-methylase UbiE
MKSTYDSEKAFFNMTASSSEGSQYQKIDFDRYANPLNPNLFPKEMMFHLIGSKKGLKILEIGCGEGIASVQLAYCGHRVVGIDISEKSLEIAKARAKHYGLDVEFVLSNFVADDFFREAQFDVVWCDAVLHHMLFDLELVMSKIDKALKSGGLFVSREPIEYAPWLMAFRRIFPIGTDTTPDERQLNKDDIQIISSFFQDLKHKQYRIMTRIDRVTRNMKIQKIAAQIDHIFLKTPIGRALAGTIVMWARK